MLRSLILLELALGVTLAAMQGIVIPVHFAFQDQAQYVGFVLSALAVVGGAALTEQFVRTRIATAYAGVVRYASDAMAGLAIMNEVCGASAAVQRREPVEPTSHLTDVPVAPRRRLSSRRTAPGVRRRDIDIPLVPHLQRRLETPSVSDVWRYVNPFMLYNRHLGLKGDLARRVAARDAS